MTLGVLAVAPFGPAPGGAALRAPRRPPGVRVLAAAAAIVFASFLAGGGAVHLDGIAPAAPSRPDLPATPEAVDPAAVAETVSHRVVADPSGSGTLAVHDRAYRATFGPDGFSFTPSGPESEPFTLSVEGLERVAAPVALHPQAWHATANVAERRLAPGVTERVTARDGEIEWDVVLDREPVGFGDLVVRADVTGGAERVAHADGLRLGSVRMGELVVNDADGVERHRSLPSVDGDELQLRVPSSVMEAAAYPLVLDPTVSPESYASPVPLALAQTQPAVAPGTSDSLVVWQDGAGNIGGARVSATGAVLDPGGIVISTAPGIQSNPAVAFDGTNWLVVWSDLRNAGGSDVYGARVAATGAVLDPTGVLVTVGTETTNQGGGLAVAFGGGTYLVVWEDARVDADGDIYGVRVSTAGAVVGSAVSVGAADVSDLRPSIASNGAAFFVVWHRGVPTDFTTNDVYGALVSSEGAVVQPDIAVSTAPSAQTQADAAFDGSRYLAVWQDNRPGGTNGIYGARVTTAGVLIDPSAFPISGGFVTSPAVASDGTISLVTWPGGGARVSQGGAVLPPGDLPNVRGSAVAFAAAGHFVAVSAAANEVFGVRVTPDGAVLDPSSRLLSQGAALQRAPAIAFDGTRHLVVWQDRRSGTSFDIYAARVTPDGAVLDPIGIPVNTAAGDQVAPAVAFDGTNFLVVWESDGDILSARVTPAGTVLPGSGTAVSAATGAQAAPAVASNGTTSLVVWQDGRTGTSIDVFGARVQPDGSVLEPSGIAVSATIGQQTEPTVASNGTDFLVAWTDDRVPVTAPDIYAATVLADGSVPLRPGGPVAAAGGEQAAASVASDGSAYLVVWRDGRSVTTDDVYGTRVNTAGTALDPGGIPVSTGPGDQGAPAVAFNGSYLVVWQDRRSGTSEDVYATRLGTDGVGLDAAAIPVATSSADELAPAVSRSDNNRWGVSYERDYGPGVGIFLRAVAPK